MSAAMADFSLYLHFKFHEERDNMEFFSKLTKSEFQKKWNLVQYATNMATNALAWTSLHILFESSLLIDWNTFSLPLVFLHNMALYLRNCW